MLKNLFAPLLACLAMLLGLIGQAHAELPAGVGTAISGAGADGLTAVGLLAAAGATVYIIYRVLKRLGIV